jgi:hypothetical protein
MAFDPLTAILNIGNTVIDRLLPDKTKADEAKAELVKMAVTGDFETMKGQIQINIAEAASGSVFVAGWRPAVGWACGSAFAYAFIIQPLIQTLLVVFHSHFDPAMLPKLDMSEMMPVLLGMLGLAGLRTYDKAKGTDNGH